MKINVNDYVKIRLNKPGLERHYADWKYYHDMYPHVDVWKEYKPPKLDAEGYHEIQLWSLMRDYGDLCTMGFTPPFETEIIVGEK